MRDNYAFDRFFIQCTVYDKYVEEKYSIKLRNKDYI